MASIIFKNFKELAKYPILKHDEQEIFDLLTSQNKFFLCAVDDNKTIGYILCELVVLDDGRKTVYISYIYVAPNWRNKKIGKQLMEKTIFFAKEKRANTVMLICDTEDNKVLDFYLTKGFMHDMNLRRYDKYDVLSLQIN